MFAIDPNIYAIIIVPDWQPTEATFMQGFSPSLCFNHWMLRAVSMLPTSILELTPEGQETLLARRMSGSFPIHCYPQSPRAARAMPLPPFMPFTLYLLPETENPQDYASWAQTCPVPPTIVAEEGGDLTFEELNPDRLRERFLDALAKVPDDVHPETVAQAIKALNSWITPIKRSLGYTVDGHGSVNPNLMALTVAGYTDIGSEPFMNINKGIKPYVDQIVSTAESILREREQVGDRDLQRIFRPTIDLNLFAPSIYPHFFESKLDQAMPLEERRSFNTVRQILDRQTGYGFDVRGEAQKRTFIRSTSQKQPSFAPHPLFLLRRRELELSTDAMGMLAASEFCAVLRLPNEINRTIGTVRNFAQLYRSASPTSRKRLLAFRQVQARLANAVPSEFVDLIRQSKTGVRVVSDAHLEWLDIDGLPLMIENTCARVPVTPGNLFISQVGPQELIHLTPADLSKVLVLNALKPEDRIARLFDLAFDAFEDAWAGKLDIRTVEVASADAMVQAINAFDGQLVIFDGHGGHDKTGPAKLYLHDEAVDVWSLRDKITRMPPIVLLSACDTHAADRNHATAGSGFLSLGARTVLSSVFPLDARHAAIFTARLLYRLADFLAPAIGLYGRGLRWCDVVSGMLRMQLLTDLLMELARQRLLTSEDLYKKIHLEGNGAINSRAPKPFAQILDLVEHAGVDRRKASLALEIAVANSSVISYLQLGRPETILIDQSERIEQQLRRLET